MYDLCVIGAGWGGFNAAIRASQLGAKVCLIEKDSLGGVCLNKGCIPTKVLAKSSELLHHIRKSDNFGISCQKTELNFSQIVNRKKIIIDKLNRGIQYQLKTRNIDVITGDAKLISPHKISVGSETIEAKNIIIATGSRPIELPTFKFNGIKNLSSDDILNVNDVPANLMIIGGGVIGCEFASIFSEFGSKVTIVELLDQILPTEDIEIAKKLEIMLKKRGVEIFTKTNAEGQALDKFDKILICVGRRPVVDSLGLEGIGVKTSKNGIIVNSYLQTNIDNIYSVGDCIGGILLAHVASYEGFIAAENIFGKKISVNYTAVPNCIFTNPEVASVGLGESQTNEESRKIKVIKFNFLACGMAHILDETDGFIKMIVDTQTEEIIGASIIGPKATELITSLAMAVRNKIKISQINDSIIAHPTLSEGILEAAREYYSV